MGIPAMCSICPRCHPPVPLDEFSPILPVPVEPFESPWGPVMPILPVPVPVDDTDDTEPLPARLSEYTIGGLICHCSQDE